MPKTMREFIERFRVLLLIFGAGLTCGGAVLSAAGSLVMLAGGLALLVMGLTWTRWPSTLQAAVFASR
jgi:hypothetical protein